MVTRPVIAKTASIRQANRRWAVASRQGDKQAKSAITSVIVAVVNRSEMGKVKKPITIRRSLQPLFSSYYLAKVLHLGMRFI